jgi:hypothetical protein
MWWPKLAMRRRVPANVYSEINECPGTHMLEVRDLRLDADAGAGRDALAWCRAAGLPTGCG